MDGNLASTEHRVALPHLSLRDINRRAWNRSPRTFNTGDWGSVTARRQWSSYLVIFLMDLHTVLYKETLATFNQGFTLFLFRFNFILVQYPGMGVYVHVYCIQMILCFFILRMRKEG